MAEYAFSREPIEVEQVSTKHRAIHTAIPAPGTAQVLKRLDEMESRSMHGQLPLVWDRAKDYNVFDIAGNKWIDFTSSIFVANVGHSNSHVSAAMLKTLEDPLYSCYAYANEVRADYLERLIEFIGPPFEKAFLLSAGTEATEAALKLARMYGQKVAKKRLGIVGIENNWHGRTLGAQMMSSNAAQKAWVGYQDTDIHHIPFPYPWEIKDETGLETLKRGLQQLAESGIDLKTDVAAFMLETFQGWGAVFYPISYVKAIKRLCEEHDILLIFDEMQAGFARTGKAFGFQHYDVVPDLVCVGKGMGGGVPISGVLGRAEIMDLPDIGNMSSTHSANPLCCAAALAVLEEIDAKKLIWEAESKGRILFQALEELEKQHAPRLGRSLGKGLIASVLFFDPETGVPDGIFASKVSEMAMQKGVLVVHTGRESIKLGPPLTIPTEALMEGIEVLSECITAVAESQ